jgi:predicted kinase
MLIGVPASGKSTWIDKQKFDPEDTVILSTDKFIDAEARAQGKTYTEVFKGAIKRATQIMKADLQMAIQDGQNLVWDQTNVTVKSRADKLNMVPDTYRKVAVFFPTPANAELARRLASRPGKTIPANVVMAMASQLETPSESEGFNEIVIV